MSFEALRRKMTPVRAAIVETEARQTRVELEQERLLRERLQVEKANREALEAFMTSCFNESSVDQLTDDLIDIVAPVDQLRKSRMDHTTLWNGNVNMHLEIYNCINLSWHKSDWWASAGVDCSIEVGFLPNGTLVIRGSSPKKIPGSNWQRDTGVIEKALVNAYHYPYKFFPRDTTNDSPL